MGRPSGKSSAVEHDLHLVCQVEGHGNDLGRLQAAEAVHEVGVPAGAGERSAGSPLAAPRP